MELLTDAQITASLAAVPGWQLAGNAITTTVKRADFRGAMAFAEQVADLAEAAGHHPDITGRLVFACGWRHAPGWRRPQDKGPLRSSRSS